MSRVFLCQTVKHLYTSIYLSYALNKGRCEPFCDITIIVCTDHQGLDSSVFDFDAIKSIGFNVILLNESEILAQFISSSLIRFHGLLSKNIIATRKGIHSASYWLKHEVFSDICLSSDVYLYHDRTFLSKFFLKYFNVTLVEDGLANYVGNKTYAGCLKKCLRKLNGLEPEIYYLGEHSSVKRIILFGNDPVPQIIKNKVQRLDYIDVFHNRAISPEVMMKLFNLSQGEVSMLEADVVLLTQGLDVARLCTLAEKSHLYGSLSNLILSFGYSLTLKLHPSESEADYLNKFPNSRVKLFSKKMPIEVLPLLNNSSPLIISLRSSAVIGSRIKVINLIDDDKVWKHFDVNEILDLAVRKLKCIL